MISGAHVVLYSVDAEADRAFFRDVLKYPFVDAGHDWLIFALPPAELAVHPVESAGGHELFLMCDDLDTFMGQMAALGVECAVPNTERWGSITRVTLPGGGTLGVYQPSHPSPLVTGDDG
jgi:catechol 2,3-dioxygenase-like lactoylglutathione lyase family enzyme